LGVYYPAACGGDYLSQAKIFRKSFEFFSKPPEPCVRSLLFAERSPRFGKGSIIIQSVEDGNLAVILTCVMFEDGGIELDVNVSIIYPEKTQLFFRCILERILLQRRIRRSNQGKPVDSRAGIASDSLSMYEAVYRVMCKRTHRLSTRGIARKPRGQSCEAAQSRAIALECPTRGNARAARPRVMYASARMPSLCALSAAMGQSETLHVRQSYCLHERNLTFRVDIKVKRE
jgi:hypothetical protein